MTYFSLRKRAPEPNPDETETVEDDAPVEALASTPQGIGGALWAGGSGPGRWLVARGQPGLAWLLYMGSVWAFGFYGGLVAFGVAAVWVLAVLLFLPRELKDRAAAAIERTAAAIERRFAGSPEPPPDPAPGGEREAVRRLLLDLIGDAHGVHLKTVLAHLQEHGQWEGRKVADLRVHLQALGIPVDPKLKVAGVPTRGVSRIALEALPPIEETTPSPTPSPPV